MASLSGIRWILSPAIGKHLRKHTKKHGRWLGGLPDRRGIFSARDLWMGSCRRDGLNSHVMIVSIGGGAAELYFALLMKKADPANDILVVERNRPDDTFGFGVVFSDATLENFAEADRETHAEITRNFDHWDDIDIHYRGEVLTSTGHGFSGMSRQLLLDILQRRCVELGVRLQFQTEASDLGAYPDADLVLAADGVNSVVRSRYAEHFRPQVDWRGNKFVWIGRA